MEAIRKTDSYHLETIRRKKGRSRRPALFGAASQLAGRSVHRDRRRFRNTSLSVGISVLLFLAAGGISLMFSSQLVQYGSETVDFKLSAEAAQTFVQPEILADAAKRVLQIAQVSRTASYGHFYMNADLQPDQFTGELTEAFQRLSAMYGQRQSNEAEMRQRMVSDMSNVRVIAADAGLIDSLKLPDQAMIAGKLSQGEALLCQLAVFSMNGLGAASIPMTTIKPGDTLSLLPMEVYDSQAEEMAKAISLPDQWKIAAELTELPWFVEGFFTGSPSLILIVDRQYLAGQYQNPDPERYEFEINESLAVEAMDGQEPVVQKTLSDMYPAAGSGINQGLVIQDNYADQKMARNLLLIINIFVYGFTTVIVLICSMNILNTVTTNVMLRRRELAMLQAVGMSRSQVGRMLFLECSLYGLTGAFWGSIFGIGLLYLLGRSIEGTISGMTISAVPWVLVSLTFAGALLIALLSGVLPIRRVMQDNVVEAIRAQE